MRNLMLLAFVLGSLVALAMATHLHHLHARKAGCQQDLCASVRCGHYSRCQVVNGRASCVCEAQNCPATRQPVCGSDGKTYCNECKLKAEACRLKKDIRVASQGECGCNSKGHKRHHRA